MPQNKGDAAEAARAAAPSEPSPSVSGKAGIDYRKGPWILNPFNAQVDSAQLDEDGNLIPVCQLLWPTPYRTEAETWAIGSLIAAAPDLLEACERMVAATEAGQHFIGTEHDAMCAAVAIARGQ